MPNLPSLTPEPARYPGCCLSLSKPLLGTIKDLLDSIPTPALTPNHTPNKTHNNDAEALLLSIGSGTGLLEELLHTYLHSHSHNSTHPHPTANLRRWRVEGVEVKQTVNTCLPEGRVHCVPGTWAVLEAPRARDAAALMFCYPRDGALVRRYVDAFMASSSSNLTVRAGDADERGHDLNRESERESKADSGSESESETAITISNEKGGDEGHGMGANRIQEIPHRGVRLVLWLGPKCDWEDTGLEYFRADEAFEIMEMRDGVGLAEYEMLATLRLKTT